MNKTEEQLRHEQEVNTRFTLDVKRAVVMTAIARYHLEAVTERKMLPKALSREILLPIQESMKSLENRVRGAYPKDRNLYLDRSLKMDKLLDIGNIVDTMLRINGEENQEIYEEFLSMVIGVINEIFYAQSHRRKFHFSKYRAIFKFVTEEMRGDINKQPSRIYIRGEDLFFRAAPPSDHSEIKDS